MTRSTAGMDRNGTGAGWNRLGPARLDGDARGPQTGSVITRLPSISISTVECPSHVARRPLAGALVQMSSGLTTGKGLLGTRRTPPHRNSLTDGIGTLGSPRGTTRVLRNRSPDHAGEDLIRSRRSPRGFEPSDFIVSRCYSMSRDGCSVSAMLIAASAEIAVAVSRLSGKRRFDL